MQMKEAGTSVCVPLCVHVCDPEEQRKYGGVGWHEGEQELGVMLTGANWWWCRYTCMPGDVNVNKISLMSIWKSLEIKAVAELPTHSLLSNIAVIFKAFTPGVIKLL